MKQLIKNTLVLTAITLVSGLLLGLVYEVTKAPIARSKENAKQKAYEKVLSEADEFQVYDEFDADATDEILAEANLPGCRVDEVITGTKDGQIVGYVITVTSTEGYGGDIQISVGICLDGKISGVEFLAISETAGLGMKAKEPEFYEQFVGKRTDAFQVVKGGSAGEEENDASSGATVTNEFTQGAEVDALSGATITSKAVTSAVNAGLTYFNQVIGGSGNE